MPDIAPRLTIEQAATSLQYTPRYLRDRLAFHKIATIGRGRSARLTVEDLQLFEAKERAWASSSSLPDDAATTQHGSSADQSVDAALKRAQTRQLRRLLSNGRSATSPGSSNSKVVPLARP